MIRIIIADDHVLLSQGIRNSLLGVKGIEVADMVSNGTALLTSLNISRPDLVLLDLNLRSDPQGNELISLIRERFPEVRILILTSNDNILSIRMAFAAGAHGYLLKNIEQDLLHEAILAVSKGDTYLSNEVKGIMAESLLKKDTANSQSASLTGRETEILRLIAEEKTSQEIADILHLSYRTVETYRLGIMKKLQVKNMVGMVKKAILLGIIR